MNLLRLDNPAAKKLAALRADIAATAKQIEAAANALYSVGETGERLRDALRAAVGRNNSTAYDVDMVRSRRAERASGRPRLRAPDWGTLVLLLGEDEIVKRLTAGLNGDDALSTPDREKRLIDLRAKLHDLEMKEECECLRLEEAEARWTIVRRADADPKLVLQVWAEHKPEHVDSTPAEPIGLDAPREPTEIFRGNPVNLR
jgi:hypothetical protein